MKELHSNLSKSWEALCGLRGKGVDLTLMGPPLLTVGKRKELVTEQVPGPEGAPEGPTVHVHWTREGRGAL